MTGGIVIGGWEFVWAAYGLTFVALAGYGMSLALRLRGREDANEITLAGEGSPRAAGTGDAGRPTRESVPSHAGAERQMQEEETFGFVFWRRRVRQASRNTREEER